MKASTLIAIAAVNGFLATGLGALASHVLGLNDRGAELFSQASDFHFVHTLALFVCAWILHTWQNNGDAGRWASRAAIFFMIGLFCFCGSLYWLGMMGPGSLGAYHWITPIGGLAFMAGWLTLAWAGVKARQN